MPVDGQRSREREAWRSARAQSQGPSARGPSVAALLVAALLPALLAGCVSTRPPKEAESASTADASPSTAVYSVGEIERPGEGRYQGQLRNGLRSGRGVQTGPEGVYEGEWANDLQDGFGELRGVNGSRYIGTWRAGLRHGTGSWASAEGETYDGDWQQDAPHGHGIHREADGTLYIGSWKQGQPDGSGRLITTSAVVYEGEWTAGERNGVGRESRPDGTRYDGEWVKGRREGTGNQRFADGSQFDGLWEFDQPAGPGTWLYPTGIQVQGVFQGPLVSSGLVTLPGGTTYAGPVTTRKANATGRSMRSPASSTLVAPPLMRWLEPVADDGNRYAQLLLGQALLINNPELTERAKALFAAAASEVPEAGYRLALLELHPTGAASAERASGAPGGEAHIPLALRDAAARDHPAANRTLGDELCQANAKPDQRARALAHYRTALRGGDPLAAERLAACLCLVAELDADAASGTAPGDVSPSPLQEAIDVLEWYATATGFWRELATLARVEALRGNIDQARNHARAALDAAMPAGGATPRVSRPTPATPMPDHPETNHEPTDAAMAELRELIEP